MCFTWESWESQRFPSFRFWPLYWNQKLRKLGNTSTLVNSLNSKECVLLEEEVGNLRGFRVFDFGPYTEIENSENSEIFSRILNLSEFLLFEEIGNFRDFRVFDYGPYTKIENSENSEIFPRLVIALLEEVRSFQGFGVFSLALILKAKSRKTRKLFQDF